MSDDERYTCLVDCGLPAELCACYLEECELNRVDKADAWDAIVEKNREITRLRAALADAQAVGFAAGVEAAAKVAAMQAVYTREAIKRATASELISNLVTVTKSRTAHDIEIAIRAIAGDTTEGEVS